MPENNLLGWPNEGTLACNFQHYQHISEEENRRTNTDSLLEDTSKNNLVKSIKKGRSMGVTEGRIDVHKLDVHFYPQVLVLDLWASPSYHELSKKSY